MLLLQTAVHFMSKKISVWKQLGASNAVLVDLQGIVIPVPQEVMFKEPSECVLTGEALAFARDQFKKNLWAGAVERCLLPRAVHKFFLILKVGSSKFQWISDLRNINPFVPYTKFKMEDIRTILLMVKKEDFMFVADLSSGYCQLRIHEDSKDLLVFYFEGQY